VAHSLARPAALRLELQGPRSIAPIGGLSTHGTGAARRAAPGAGYPACDATSGRQTEGPDTSYMGVAAAV